MNLFLTFWKPMLNTGTEWWSNNTEGHYPITANMQTPRKTWVSSVPYLNMEIWNYFQKACITQKRVDWSPHCVTLFFRTSLKKDSWQSENGMTHQELFAETVLSQAFLNIFHYKILGFAGRNLLYPNFPYGKFLERLSFAYSTRTCLFFQLNSQYQSIMKFWKI